MFSVLKPYVGIASGPIRFIQVDKEDILKAETALGFSLPEDLKTFYQEIGYGWFGVDGRRDIRNLLFHPLDLVDFFHGTSEFSLPESFLPGDMPFFDCGAGRFLVYRPTTNRYTEIFRDNGEAIALASDLSDFVSHMLANPLFYEK